MYKLIVRAIARRTFRRLSRGDLDGFMAVFGPSSFFCFHGDHALGGELRGAEAVRAVFERTLRLFPGITVEPVRIAVNGWPWNTLLATRFVVSAELPDGSRYRNDGMQYARLHWGTVVEDRLYEDTRVLADALDLLARLGNEEAAAPPLGPLPTDGPGLRPADAAPATVDATA
jgi:ketosteroid isomerase-like protein